MTFLNAAEFMGACWFIRYMQQQYCVSKCPLVTAKKNYDFFPPPAVDAVSLLTFIPITGPLIFIFASCFYPQRPTAR